MLDLSLLFDYDRWATQRWLAVLPGLQNLGRAHEILEHMVWAQQVWLGRVGNPIEHGQTNVPLSSVFEGLNREWKRVVEERDLDEVIEYQTTSGSEHRNTLGEIAYHVVNHGTYHRGQLRGLAESEAFPGFPETDLIFFLREQG